MPIRPAPCASAGIAPRRSARRVFARAPLAFALRLCLALALVLVQGGALTHVVRHTAELSASRNGPDARFDTDEGARHLAYCVDCLSLSGIDLPLSGHGDHAFGIGASLAPSVFRSADLPARDGLAPRCRAPPPPVRRA